MPRLIVLRDGEWDCPVVPLLAAEIGKAPAWYRAHTDPIAGQALRLLHNNPEHRWTVGSRPARSASRGRRWPGALPSRSASRPWRS